MFDLLQQQALLLRGPLARWEAASDRYNDPRDAIMRASWGAHTIGEAFFAGYQGALESLIGGKRSKALLVTELTGQHPGSLTTRLEPNRVTGNKAFAMTDVEEWWVLGVAGPRDLQLVRVSPSDPGVAVTPFSTSFVPDVPHGSVDLSGVVYDRALPDAWARYVRPFRSIEDGGVLLALATALLGAVEDPGIEDELLGLIAGLYGLFGRADDASFRALIGMRKQLLLVAERSDLVGPLADGWQGYRTLVDIAQSARLARLKRARERTSFMSG